MPSTIMISLGSTCTVSFNREEVECAKWEEAYGEKASPKSETMHEKIQRYKEKADRQNASQPYRSRDKGAR